MHMKTHQIVPPYQCNDCDKTCKSKAQLENHVNTSHSEKTEVSNLWQYNCEDCPLQGETGLDLKKHIRRKHCPSEYNERCYTCKKEFKSYWHLMEHRKAEHPLSRCADIFERKFVTLTRTQVGKAMRLNLLKI